VFYQLFAQFGASKTPGKLLQLFNLSINAVNSFDERMKLEFVMI
jgi:hypothetical protein